MIDNSEACARIMNPGWAPDGDTFWYTELLDRSKSTGGNNRYRLLRSFRHHSGQELLEQMPTIRQLCDQTGLRAYLRLSPRSYAAVGKLCAQLVLEAALVGHWKDMGHIYASACGRSSIHGRKMWLYDVDDITPETEELGRYLALSGWLVGELPSKKGLHYIVRPHDVRNDPPHPYVQIHKDNPTNLYIP